MNKEISYPLASASNEQDSLVAAEGETFDLTPDAVGLTTEAEHEEVQPIELDACAENCGHPKCANGCNFPRVGTAACGLSILAISQE